MTEATKVAHILLAMLAAQEEVKYIQKTAKTGTKNDSPKGVARDEVVAVVRPVLIKNKILAVTTQVPCTERYVETTQKSASGTPLIQFYAVYETIFSSAVDGSSIAVRHGAQGNDYGDKACGKASTYAEKLNFLKGLVVETGIEDEGRYPDEGDQEQGEGESDIKEPQSKSKKDVEPADKSGPASKGMILQLKTSAENKVVMDKVEKNVKSKAADGTFETLTKDQVKALIAWVNEQPDAE
jgi:hypothetical protein